MSRRAAGPREPVTTGTVEPGDHKAGRWTALLQSALFADLMSVLFLATGLLLGLSTVTIFAGGIARCLGLVLGSLSVIAVLRLRWWAFVPGAVAAVLCAGLSLFLAEDRALWFSRWADFFGWILSGAPAGSAPGDHALFALECLLAFGVALILFALIRRLFSLPLLLAAAAACLGALAAASGADLSAAVCFCAAGFIVLLPRVYAAHCGVSDNPSRASLQTAALPAALAALVASLLVIPTDTSAWQSRGLRNLANDVGMLLDGPFTQAPGGASNFSLAGVGFGSETGRLGGPAQPTDTPVLVVSSDTPALLRGAVRDHYTGDHWIVGENDGDFRFRSLFWRRYRREAFDRDKSLAGEARDLYPQLQRDIRMQITYLPNRYTAIFAPGQVEALSFPGRKLEEEIWFNMRGELYLHARIPTRTRVQVDTTLWNHAAPSFQADFPALEQLAMGVDDPRYGAIADRYTQLPDSLPPSVRRAARDIVEHSGTPYEKALAISQWLAENCTYTLTPDVPPEDEDFVAHFLETRQGYCTYYATAMAVLARCEGLPARYVSGFALIPHPDNDQLYQATEATAHAWAEIYFQGIGWVEFDPLGWNVSEPLNSVREEPEAEEDPAPSADSLHEREESPLSQPGEPDEAVAVGQVLVPALAIGAALLALCALGVWLLVRRLMGRKRRAFRSENVLRRYPGPADALAFYCADIRRQLALLGLSPRPGETITVYADRIDRLLPLDGVSFRTVGAAKTRLDFGGAAPSEEELYTAIRYHHQLENRLRERLGAGRYLVLRALQPNIPPTGADIASDQLH